MDKPHSGAASPPPENREDLSRAVRDCEKHLEFCRKMYEAEGDDSWLRHMRFWESQLQSARRALDEEKSQRRKARS